MRPNPGSRLVMSIGNQKFGIPTYLPRKYQYQIGIWYFCSKFPGIFLVFHRYLEHGLLKIWLIIDIFRQNKIGLVFGFCVCHFIGRYRFGFGLSFFLKMTSLVSAGETGPGVSAGETGPKVTAGETRSRVSDGKT